MTWVDELFQDIRYGARSLVKRPGYAALAVATLGLGIGANTAIFSVINGVLLKPLPYEHGDRLAIVRQSAPLSGQPQMGVAVAEYYDYREQAKVFDGLVEYHQITSTCFRTNRGEPDRVDAGVSRTTFFDLLGIKPILGRSFVRATTAWCGAVLMLSHRYCGRNSAPIWRSSGGCSDERPAPPFIGRTAQRAALSTGERRLHAGAGVPVSRSSRTKYRTEPARIRCAQCLWPSTPRRIARTGRFRHCDDQSPVRSRVPERLSSGELRIPSHRSRAASCAHGRCARASLNSPRMTALVLLIACATWRASRSRACSAAIGTGLRSALGAVAAARASIATESTLLAVAEARSASSSRSGPWTCHTLDLSALYGRTGECFD